MKSSSPAAFPLTAAGVIADCYPLYFFICSLRYGPETFKLASLNERVCLAKVMVWRDCETSAEKGQRYDEIPTQEKFHQENSRES